MQLELTGKLFVIAAPSGAGKTSLVRALTRRMPNVLVAVSHTTRPKRRHEVEGENYHFVSTEQFRHMVAENEFVEHAEVFGNHYGTSWQSITSIRQEGENTILEIDWQGAARIREVITDCITVFILPPSLNALRSRLEQRAQDDPAIIKRRMAAAINEISHYDEFDYVIVNDKFKTALSELEMIMTGDGDRFAMPGQQNHLAGLLKDLLCA